MKSDKELYKLFSSCPELLFEAANSKPCDTYKMVSITLKEFERRSDGFLQPTSESVFSRWMQERFKNLSYEEVIKMFVELTPLENTRSYKELVAIGEKKGEKKGRKEGEKTGRKEGEKKAARQIITRLVTQKFNIKSQRISPRLRSLRTRDMIELADQILSMNSYEDAFQWIDERKKKLTQNKLI